MPPLIKRHYQLQPCVVVSWNNGNTGTVLFLQQLQMLLRESAATKERADLLRFPNNLGNLVLLEDCVFDYQLQSVNQAMNTEKQKPRFVKPGQLFA